MASKYNKKMLLIFNNKKKLKTCLFIRDLIDVY